MSNGLTLEIIGLESTEKSEKFIHPGWWLFIAWFYGFRSLKTSPLFPNTALVDRSVNDAFLPIPTPDVVYHPIMWCINDTFLYTSEPTVILIKAILQHFGGWFSPCFGYCLRYNLWIWHGSIPISRFVPTTPVGLDVFLKPLWQFALLTDRFVKHVGNDLPVSPSTCSRPQRLKLVQLHLHRY